MQDHYGGSLDGATNRYLDDCAEAQESQEATDNEVYSYCETCFYCSKKILPRDTALTFNGGRTWFCESHLEERSGEELAIDNGCDPDVMHRYLEVTE